MIRVARLSSLVTIAVMACGTAQAQEPGKIGITMAYPASVGVIWDASKAIAIRPMITFGGTSSNGSGLTSQSSNWNVGVNLSALVYVKKYDNVRTYVSPGYRYSHSSASLTPSTTIQGSVSNIDTSVNGNGASGTFGAEYAPGSRVRIYGEVGFAFTHMTSSSSSTAALKISGNSWGTIAGVGFVFYP
jgi:hypothetical protein